MKILVTGGLGYIGSHAVIKLNQLGHEAVIVDNLTNSYQSVLNNIKNITQKDILFFDADIKNTELITKILCNHNIDAVMHFAGVKSVAESEINPILYYSENVAGTVSILNAMQNSNVNKIIFSSSATVYGDPDWLPIQEMHKTQPTNVYGKTKLIIEGILKDLFNSQPNWSIYVLRYFNPIGAHESYAIGDKPKKNAENIVPAIAKVFNKEVSAFNIFGNNYPTKDGTAIRDYIHICDLVDGHIACLNKINTPAFNIINLGSGTGFTVLELLNAFENVSGIKIPYNIKPNRIGDIAISYAKIDYAQQLINWKPTRTLYDMCESAYQFMIR